MIMERLEMDAFSDAQIASKLWLCEELEAIAPAHFKTAATLWVLGGWYGMLPFLLLVRGKLKIERVRSFDIDPEATRAANLLNNHWEIQQWMFRAFTVDVNQLSYGENDYGPEPDIVVNTSCEHFDSLAWWERVPAGKLVVLQSTDMPHEEHHHGAGSLEGMRALYGAGFEQIHFAGQKKFSYPDKSFRRYMLIGTKGCLEQLL
jgi:hypothetical protein